MSPRCLLVVGMHRSGTSAVTRILANAGYALGREVIQQGPDNPAGFWENTAIVETHEDLLTSLGSSWNDPRPLPVDWLKRAPARLARERLLRLLDSEFDGAEKFVVKDPRLCRLLPLWKDVLAERGIDAGVVLVVRHPGEVAASLKRRNDIAAMPAQWLWASCMANAWLDCKAWPHATLEYSRLLQEPNAALKALASELDLPAFAKHSYATLDEKLRHHRSDKSPLGPANDLYGALVAQPQRVGEVDRIARNVLAQSVPDELVQQWFGQVTQALKRAQDEATLNARDAEKLQAALNDASAWATERDLALSTQLSRVLAWEGELSEAARWGSERDEALSAQLSRVSVLEGELSEAARWSAERDEALSAHLSRVSVLEGELSEAARWGAERDEALSAQLSRVSALEAELSQATRWGTERDEALSAQLWRVSMLESELSEATRWGTERDEAYLAQLSRTALLESELAKSLRQIESLHGDRVRMEERIEELVNRVQDMAQASNEDQLHNRLIHDGLQNQINLLTKWKSEQERRQYVKRALSAAYRGVHGSAYRAQVGIKSALKSGMKRLCMAWPGTPNQKEARLAYLRTLNHARDGVNGAAILQDIHALAEDRWPARPSYVIRGREAPEVWPELDISVVLYNSARWISGFMQSLLDGGYPIEKLSLHFRDHGSDEVSRQALDAWVESHPEAVFGSVRYSQGFNAGFGAGHNHNFRSSMTHWFLVANVDGRFSANALENVVLAGLHSIDGVGAFELRQTPYEHPKYYDPVSMQTSWFSGACVLFKREAFARAKGFDDAIFMYGEDVELSYRMRSMGMSLAYVPAAVFEHDTYEEANAFKPLQFHGSTLANLLLRMRYGRLRDFVGIPAMIKELAVAANAQSEMRGFRRNMLKFALKAPRYLLSRLWTRHIPLPFNRWDYGLRRDGVFESVQPINAGPLVSIVVRTYAGREHLLEQALCSIANQTYGNVEAIVVEDKGVTQRDVAERCAAKWGLRVRFQGVVTAESNRCLTGNRGLELATGQYANFLDDDDLFFADHVEYLVSRFLQSPDQHVAHYSLSWQVAGLWNESGRYEERLHEAPPGFRREFDRSVLSMFNFMPIQAVMFERHLFEKYGGFDVRLENLEDWELWRRYSRAGDFKLAPKTTSLFHVPWCVETRAIRQALLDDYYPIANEIAMEHEEGQQ